MVDVFERLYDELRQGRRVALLTLVDSRGATPQRAGSRLLLLQSGETVGTIGGGAGEYAAVKASRENLAKGRSCLLSYDLGSGGAADIGAVCGGQMTIFCQVVAPEAASCIGMIADCRKRRRPCDVVYDLTDPQRWAMAVVGEEMLCCGDQQAAAALGRSLSAGSWPERGYTISGAGRWYREHISCAARVILFGAGHVAQALSRLLPDLSFDYVVVDDREEFANEERFPQAQEIVLADFDCLPPSLAVEAGDYVCIMTRGHAGDYSVQRQVMAKRPAYIGVIGSRAKLRFVREKLLSDGFSQAEIDACYGPIGLPISAATPAEIAVSIAAELIAVRARNEGREKNDARKWGAADVPHIRLPE